MTERPGVQPDSFVEFRTSKEGDVFVPWERWREVVSIYFPQSTIPSDIEPHLREWYTLRNRVRINLIPTEEYRQLQVRFSEEHSTLFEINGVLKAIKDITQKFPLAA